MPSPSDDDFQTPPPTAPIDDTPTVSCSRCGNEWDLAYELDELKLGNQSVEQFALDHHRHTGHFPDDVSPWVTNCRQCPATDQFLSEGAARRWARTHARHTRHDVAVDHADEQSVVTPE
ncbi:MULTISPECIES: hypothetical protein [Haloferax]|uniref:Uncharacterized protein n=1 Tax=Haloferax marinum TaxID=2666143 RepID=A0A6A8G998_9EURY|nr:MULTISPECIES: hypothetical protein [Haloferax]KAB1197805.1 hypothetical protein Hfx1150_09840 [Haloferax sp. CBA1150]MRW96863.1 hypothetical protein [Haloferax marinum]